jgi:hypothetical protein
MSKNILYVHLEECLLVPKQEEIIDSNSIFVVRSYLKLLQPSEVNVISQTCISSIDIKAFWKNAAPFVENTIGLDLKINCLVSANEYIGGITKYFKNRNLHISDRTRMGLLEDRRLSFFMYADTKYKHKQVSVFYINRNISKMSLLREDELDIVCLPNKYIPSYISHKNGNR